MAKTLSEETPITPEPRAPEVIDARVGVRNVTTGEVTLMPTFDYKNRDIQRPYSRYSLPGRKDLFIVAPPHEKITEDILKSFLPVGS